ncbi:MAG: response regulator transcription factor [Candidatus Gastranaerophilales bacterium]|nr:response regulator transcription factor [Candidatus Gastranaerophilales bacterium]
MNKKVSIYIVEDYLLARVTCRKALEQFDDLEIKNDFETAEECIKTLEKNSVDVILMDIGLPYMTGIEATKIIKEKYPNTKIIMLTSHDNQEEIISSLASGANAYALKDISVEDLHDAIINTNKGCIWIHPKIATIINQTFVNAKLKPKDDFNLTSREKEVLELLTQGLSNTEIADKLIISTHTAKAHVCNILTKLSVTDRVQAAVKATKYDL